MVGKRLNKIVARCQLNWRIVDCVEELTVNFLTNTVQEENLKMLINEINKEYAPKFLKRDMANEISELIQGAKIHLDEIKQLNLNEISTQVDASKKKGINELEEVLEQLQKVFNGFEYDIAEDEDKCESLSLNLNEEEKEEFNNIIEERKEILSRLEVMIENTINVLKKL